MTLLAIEIAQIDACLLGRLNESVACGVRRLALLDNGETGFHRIQTTLAALKRPLVQEDFSGIACAHDDPVTVNTTDLDPHRLLKGSPSHADIDSRNFP